MRNDLGTGAILMFIGLFIGAFAAVYVYWMGGL